MEAILHMTEQKEISAGHRKEARYYKDRFPFVLPYISRQFDQVLASPKAKQKSEHLL